MECLGQAAAQELRFIEAQGLEEFVFVIQVSWSLWDSFHRSLAGILERVVGSIYWTASERIGLDQLV